MRIKFYGGPYHGQGHQVKEISQKLPILIPPMLDEVDITKEPSEFGGKLKIAFYDLMTVFDENIMCKVKVYVFAGMEDWK